MAGQRGRGVSRGGSGGSQGGARERTAGAAPDAGGLTPRPADPGPARRQGPAPDGLKLAPGYLDRPAQEALAAAVADVIVRAPLYTPRMPGSGRPFSVRMTNC